MIDERRWVWFGGSEHATRRRRGSRPESGAVPQPWVSNGFGRDDTSRNACAEGMLRHHPVAGSREAGPDSVAASSFHGFGLAARVEEPLRDRSHRLPWHLGFRRAPPRPDRGGGGVAGPRFALWVSVPRSGRRSVRRRGRRGPDPCGDRRRRRHRGSRRAAGLVPHRGPGHDRRPAPRRTGGGLGWRAPRYADSGLLCGIDGAPASGCGERTADGYRYWAYFSGTSGSWVYGSGNPFIRRLADGDIEGWRFVDGTGTGQDPPPRITPSAGSSRRSRRRLHRRLRPPRPRPQPPPASPGPPPASSRGDVPGRAATAPTAEVGGSSVDPTGDGSRRCHGRHGRRWRRPRVIVRSNRRRHPGPDRRARSLSAPSGSDASGSGPIGVILAAIVIAGLVAATVVRARSRR